MKRIDKYKSKRAKKRKSSALAFIFLFLIISGICMVDYSVNQLVMNKRTIEVVSLDYKGSYRYELTILNKTLHINTFYIQRDFRKVKNSIYGTK